MTCRPVMALPFRALLQIMQPRVSTGHSASTTPTSKPPRTAT
jgi:hypothetical protein